MTRNEISIRPYKKIDKAGLRKISIETVFMGDSGQMFWDDKEILADWLTHYYLEFEPESSFIAEYQNKIVGYLMGCLNTKRYHKILNQRTVPLLFLKSLCRGMFLKVKVWRFIYYSLRSFLRREFRRPDFSLEYPAHLHINIEAQFRKRGIGTRLIEVFFSYLRSKGIKGLHAWTMTEGGKNLFKSLGFNLLYSQKVTYFDYILNKELSLSCWGKKI